MFKESLAGKNARRSFLKAIGVTAAATLPFYKMLEDNVAHAQTGVRPLGFVGFGVFHGTVARHYSRQPGETGTSFSLTYPDSPFSPFDDATTYGESFKSRLSIFEGFDHGVGEWDANGNPTHVPMHGAMGQVLTGSSPGSSPGSVQNASLDQVLADKYGGDTLFRSVRLRGLDQWAFPGDAGWLLSFGSGGAPLPTLELPPDIWSAYFQQAIVGVDPAAQAAAARKQAIGASVLDFVTKDITRLNSRLAAAEKQKLDQHLTVVRGLEQRLTALPVSTSTCNAPGSRPRSYDKFTNGEILKAWDLQCDMFAELFACGLTRYGTFLFPGETGPGLTSTTSRYTGANMPVEDGTEGDQVCGSFHDENAHRLDDATSALGLYSQQRLAAINRFYFSRVAKFMRRLSQAGVLDSTVIVVGGEGGQASGHSTQCAPLLVAGGANGKLALGKRVVHAARTASANAYPSGAAWTSFNPVLAGIANLWGENLSSFGTCAKTDLTQTYNGVLG